MKGFSRKKLIWDNSWFCKASLRICYVSLFECKGPSMLKTLINCQVKNRGLQNQTEKVSCTVIMCTSPPPPPPLSLSAGRGGGG